MSVLLNQSVTGGLGKSQKKQHLTLFSPEWQIAVVFAHIEEQQQGNLTQYEVRTAVVAEELNALAGLPHDYLT